MFKMSQFMVPVAVEQMTVCLEVANTIMAEFVITFEEIDTQIRFRVKAGGLTADTEQEKTRTRAPESDCGTEFLFEGTDAAVKVEPIVLANGGRLAIVCWAPTTAELP